MAITSNLLPAITHPYRHFTARDKRIPCYSLYGLFGDKVMFLSQSQMFRCLCNQDFFVVFFFCEESD